MSLLTETLKITLLVCWLVIFLINSHVESYAWILTNIYISSHIFSGYFEIRIFGGILHKPLLRHLFVVLLSVLILESIDVLCVIWLLFWFLTFWKTIKLHSLLYRNIIINSKAIVHVYFHDGLNIMSFSLNWRLDINYLDLGCHYWHPPFVYNTIFHSCTTFWSSRV